MITAPSATSPEGQASASSASPTTTPEEVRNRLAALLSLMPGLGHLYKGHVLVGGLIFFLIGPLVLVLGICIAIPTLGVGLAIPLFFMLGVIGHAYSIPDRRQEVPKQFRALEHGAPKPVPEPDAK